MMMIGELVPLTGKAIVMTVRQIILYENRYGVVLFLEAVFEAIDLRVRDL